MNTTNALIVPNHDIYISIAEDGDKIKWGIGSSASSSRDHLSGKRERPSSSKKILEGNVEPKSVSQKKFSDLLRSVDESMAGYHELVMLSGLMAKIVTGPLGSHKVKEFAKSKLDIVEVGDGYKTYGMRDQITSEFMDMMDDNSRTLSGFLFLPPAMLMGAVSFYDSALTEALKIFLSMNPERFKKSDKTFTAEEIFKLESIEEVVLKIVDDEIDAIMRGSHSSQVEFIDKYLKTDIVSNFDKWGEFVEIFERRNIIAHAGGAANKIYVTNCTKAGLKKIPPLGADLRISRAYIRGAINILHEMLVRIIFELWSKIESGKKNLLYFSVNDTAFRLIGHKNYNTSRRIISFVLAKNDHSSSEEARRMMSVNAAICAKFQKDEAGVESALNLFQWDSVSANFKMCIAAVNEDVQTAISLIPVVKATESISGRDLMKWPAFHWIRGNADFQEAVRDHYGLQI